MDNSLGWSSFFGGSGNEQGYGIDFSEFNDDVIIAGQTTSDNSSFLIQNLAIPDPAVQFNSSISGQDGFVTVFNNIEETTGGYIPRYSSYFGGTNEDLCRNVEITPNGNAYVVGATNSNNFPLQQLTGGYNQSQLENDPTGVHFDSHIFSLNPSLQYQWSTLFGGERYLNGSNTAATSNDFIYGLTVFGDQTLYVGGETGSDENFPTEVDFNVSPMAYFQASNSGFGNGTTSLDGFLSQFGLTGTVLSLEELTNGMNSGDVLIYPNPSNGEFTISGNDLKLSGDVFIEVINIIGQPVYIGTAQVSNGTLIKTINLENQANGLYIVNFVQGNTHFSKMINKN